MMPHSAEFSHEACVSSAIMAPATGNALDGTVAIVTGASSGIGSATSRVLAAAGAHVAVVARRAARLELLAEDIHRSGGRATVIQADLSIERSAVEMIHQVTATLGRLDILVNNAGVMILGNVVDASTSDWTRMIDVNLRALTTSTHAALPYLARAALEKPRNVSDVINVSSISGRVASRFAAMYSATKHAVVAFSDALRQEAAAAHVRISVVEPGTTATELLQQSPADVVAQVRSRYGDVRTLDPDDVAHAILFIVTRPRHVTVSELVVRPTAAG